MTQKKETSLLLYGRDHLNLIETGVIIYAHNQEKSKTTAARVNCQGISQTFNTCWQMINLTGSRLVVYPPPH